MEGLDILVVNAGGAPPGLLDQVDDETWEKAFHLTTMSAVWLWRNAIPHLKRSKQGRIVNITSAYVKEPSNLLLLSNAFRPGVTAMAKMLSAELAPLGVTVNCIGPNSILTDRTRSIATANAERAGISLEEQLERNAAALPMGRYGDAIRAWRALRLPLLGAGRLPHRPDDRHRRRHEQEHFLVAIKFAQRMENLGTEGAFEVLAKARRLEAGGKKIVHLEIGEPDFATPDNIVEAAYGAMHADYTHYTPAGGILEVRQAVADFLNRRLGDRRRPARGGHGARFQERAALHASCLHRAGRRGDPPGPWLPGLRIPGALHRGEAGPIRLREGRDFRMDLDELASLVTARTRMLIVNTPQNPTGGILTREDVEFISRLAVERDLLVISDEIYSQIVYGDFEHVSPLSQPGMRERTVLLDGMSKSYAMTGWRLGYAVAPRELAARMETLMINSSSCAAAFTQMAAIEALSAPESDMAVKRMVAEFQRRRDLMVDGLNRIPGFRCARPEGAFCTLSRTSRARAWTSG